MSSVAWNQLPDVRSPVGRTAADLLAEGPRRQALPGFEPVYRDIVDHIVRCTHRIWEQKDIGLCRSLYADRCVMHTLNGPSSGVESVVQGTLSALSAFADRQVVAEDVIWSEDAPGLFYSSHRIISRSTHEGVDALYGATARATARASFARRCWPRPDRTDVADFAARPPPAPGGPPGARHTRRARLCKKAGAASQSCVEGEEDVMDAMLFLADDAAARVTGSAPRVTGGRTAA